MKLLSSLDEKDTILIPKAKNNNGILLLGAKKIFLLDNLILANTPITCKKL